MTGKERMTRASLGMEIDRVPWAPMLYQWFNVKRYNKELPEELKECKDTLEALRLMKADLFAKHEAFIVYSNYSVCSFNYSYKGNKLKVRELKTCLMDMFGPHGNIDFEEKLERHDTINTPLGVLTSVWQYNEKSGAPQLKKYLWNDFNKEYKIVKFLINDINFVPDKDRWENVLGVLANDGIAHIRIPPTSLKFLHWLAGLENATYFIIDFPDKISDIVRIYEKKRLELIKKVVDFPDSLIFTSGDNMDSLSYTPAIFEEFCGNSFSQIAEVLHEKNKLLFTHACGQLKKIIGLCQKSGIDGMEGMAAPPLGDIEFFEARGILGDRFVFQGGMTVKEEETKEKNSKEIIFKEVGELFKSLDNKKAFIFGSGCCTGPNADYNNLLAIRNACWKYGRF